jgi:general secretion pathway protein G
MYLRSKLNAETLLFPFHKSLVAGRQAAMSLIEIIIVISLIGVIMTIVVTQLTSKQDEAMKDAAVLSMGTLGQSLQLYRVHNFKYPGTDQGLDALVRNPGNAAKWRGPYTEEAKLNDPWGTKYGYESDGKNFKIISAGPDTSLGNEDDIFYPEEKKPE